MSFILEALKKSENKRRKKSAQLPRTIHEPLAYKISRPRTWSFWILIFLVINTVVMIWFWGPWKQSTFSQLAIEQAQIEPFLPKKNASVTPSPTDQADQQKTETLPVAKQFPVENDVKGHDINNLPLPRNEKQIYTFQQLPLSIQREIPALQMSLHAYNRADTKSSMIQVNNQIYRSGDKISDSLLLEKITADGAVLRFDGYLFLLPRRGN